MEEKQTFCLSILGRPVTKKRARVFKNGGRITPDLWYEEMIQDAFVEAYPEANPIGHSFCEPNPDPDEYEWVVRDGVKDKNLPKVRMFAIFYFSGGKLGDADNYLKSIKDALNGYAWVDDKQVKFSPPWVILDPDEVDRVDILINSHYDEKKDKFLQKVQGIISKRKIEVDLTEDYYE